MIIGWIVFSLIVGTIGTERKIGFWGAFLLSLVLSPIIGLILALISEKKNPTPTKVEVINQTDQPLSAPAPAESQADQLTKWKALLDSGAITQIEYDQKKAEILGNMTV